MSRCETPLPCCDCCTHRLFTPSIEWSADVWRGHCGDSQEAIPYPQAVVDSWYHDGVYYLLAEIPKTWESGLWGLRWRYRAEAWSDAGERLWKSDWLFEMTDPGVSPTRTPRGCIASDGSTVWVAVMDNAATAQSTMFRLDADDGAILFEGAAGLNQTPPLEVWALLPDAGGVLIGHQTTGSGTAFVSTWADDVVTPVVGPPDDIATDSTAFSVQHDAESGAYYVGHSVFFTRTFANGTEGDCEKAGFLSRYDGGELTWLSYPSSGDTEAGTGVERPLVRLIGETLFFADALLYRDGPTFARRTFGAVEIAWGVPEWFRYLEREVDDDDPCHLAITDFDGDDDSLWLSACRFVVQLDHAGVVVEAVPHVPQDAIHYDGSQVLTVAADGAGNALAGGIAAKCAVTDDEDRTSAALSCAAYSPGCELGEAVEPEYCHVHECGSTSNNGRVAIDECDPEQWPPCEGPGMIQWNCGSGSETRTLTFVSECMTGGRRWVGAFSGGSVTIDWICGSGPTVEVVLTGCTVTITSVTYECDGPLGYLNVSYTFDLDCGDCTGSGCGAFGSEDCEIGGPIQDVCGCDEIPRTLTATITNTNCDTDYDGLQITLEYDEGSTDWSGSTTAPNGKTVGLRMGCNNISGLSGVDCTVNFLSLGMGDPAWVCGPPFEATFAGASITGTGCCDGAGSTVDVVITE